MAMRDYGSLPGLTGLPGQEGEPDLAQARHATRIGDAERDAAATELGEHYVAGRLTLDELHDRLGYVLAARTRGQLLHAMADLPVSRQPTARATAPSAADKSRQDQEREPSDTAGRFAAVALLLIAMLLWLLTALLFANHGYYYMHHPYPGYSNPSWQGGWQQQP